MKPSRFARFRPLWPAVALLIGLVLAATTLTAVHALSTGQVEPLAAPGGIEGLLHEPDGATPVAGGWIDVHDAEEQPWMGADTAPDGSFAIPNLPPGHYTLRAYPPQGSAYAGSLPVQVEVLSGQWAATNVLLTEVRISGWVQDSDTGGRIEGATVVAYDDAWTVEQWATTNVTGEFKIGGVQIGATYNLEAIAPPGSPYVPLPIHYTAVPITTDVVLEMHIPPTNVVGIVHDPIGAPVPGAGVVVFRDDFWRETRADEMGGFRFRGLPTGEFKIHAAPPWEAKGLIASEPFTITITAFDALVDVGVITLPHAYKTANGRVIFAGTTNGVPDAVVTAHRLDGPGYAEGPTDPAGDYNLSLTGGEWHLNVEPRQPPAQWIFAEPPVWIVFAHDTAPQTETVTLPVVPTDAWVAGRIVCPGGGVCPGDPPHQDIVVELRHDELRNSASLGPDYRFNIPIPHGWYKLVVHLHHPGMQGPAPIHVFVGPGQTLDVNDVALLLKDAHIVGRVFNEFGAGVPGVPVFGWQPEGVGRGRAETDANGFYDMPVIGGEWFVEPQPGPERPYVFRQHPPMVRVAPGGTVAGVDLGLTYAGARIRGLAVDAHTYEPLWGLDGGARAELYVGPPGHFEFFSDAPMRDGGFELKVQGGAQYNVSLDVPPHAPYVSGGIGPVPVAPGGFVTVEVPLEHKNTAVEGHLIDALTGFPAAGPIWGEVFGEDERGHWAGVGVNPATAAYGMGVVSGTWRLRARVDPASGYVAVPTTTVVTAYAGSPVVQNFEVWPIKAHISGTVQKPDGAPLQAFVFAEGESPFVGHFETHVWSDAAGDFDLRVPEGVYVVGAGLPPDELAAQDWLPPSPLEGVAVSATSPATGLAFRFRRLDGEIHGAITFVPGAVVTATHPAFVWGWAEGGGRAETEAHVVPGTNTFTYTMRVISDTVWHIGAVYEDWDNGVFYESAEAVVPVPPPSGQAIRDLALGGPWPLPQPFIVSFDGSQMQTIVMPDGTELRIPPGALVVSGTVTLFIFPTQELRPEPGREVIGVGYEMWAVDQNGQDITEFNKNVVMVFHYPPDAELAKRGIAEHRLIPVYYSTLVGRWILADSYVLNTIHNEITLNINHFTTFGVASTGPKQYHAYLPLVLRGVQ
jgi:hypothetical protein